MRISDWSSDVCSSDLFHDHEYWFLVCLALLNDSRAASFERRGGRCPLSHDVISSKAQRPRASDSRRPSVRCWPLPRSEERRVGKECVSTCRYRWLQAH